MQSNEALLQQRFNTLQRWMLHPEGIRDDNLRNHLASANANYSVLWEHATTHEGKNELLTAMYVRVYSSQCDDSIANIQTINSKFEQLITIPERGEMTWERYGGTMTNVNMLSAYANELYMTLETGMQRCFEQARAWLCHPGEIDNEEIRKRLVIYAHGMGSASMWANARSQQEKEDMLTSMYVEKYSAICDQYHIRIYKLIRFYNLHPDISHPSCILSTQDTHCLSALKSYSCRLRHEILACTKQGEIKHKLLKKYWKDIMKCLIMLWNHLQSTRPECIGQLTNGDGELLCANDIIAFPAIFEGDGMFSVKKLLESPEKTILHMERLLKTMQVQP